MTSEKDIPAHVKEWERTNPRAYEMYRQEFLADRSAQIPLILKKIEPLANSIVECVDTTDQNAWKCFRSKAHELEDPTDMIQILALYDAVFEKLEFEDKKQLAGFKVS